jgi:hypothetical protein
VAIWQLTSLELFARRYLDGAVVFEEPIRPAVAEDPSRAATSPPA